jgi:hypothetical protein
MRRRSNNPQNLNQLAAYIMERATSDVPIEDIQQGQSQEIEKNPAAVALG